MSFPNPSDCRAPSTRLFSSLLNAHLCVVGKVWQEVPECHIPPTFWSARGASDIRSTKHENQWRRLSRWLQSLKRGWLKGGFKRPVKGQTCFTAVSPWARLPDGRPGGLHSWFSWPEPLRCLHGKPTAKNPIHHLFQMGKGCEWVFCVGFGYHHVCLFYFCCCCFCGQSASSWGSL